MCLTAAFCCSHRDELMFITKDTLPLLYDLATASSPPVLTAAYFKQFNELYYYTDKHKLQGTFQFYRSVFLPTSSHQHDS